MRDERRERQESRTLRSFMVYLDTSQTSTAPVGLMYSSYPNTARYVTILPWTALNMDAVNYWTMALKVRDETGTVIRGVPVSERQTLLVDNSAKKLTAGQPKRFGPIDEALQKGESLWLEVAEFGTAVDFAATIQTDVVPGGF